MHARSGQCSSACLSELRADDVVVVTRLDRLARSTSELLRIAETIEEKNRWTSIHCGALG